MWASGGLLVSDDYYTRPLVQGFYWLANQSHTVGGLDPHIRKHRKAKSQIKVWLEVPADFLEIYVWHKTLRSSSSHNPAYVHGPTKMYHWIIY